MQFCAIYLFERAQPAIIVSLMSGVSANPQLVPVVAGVYISSLGDIPETLQLLFAMRSRSMLSAIFKFKKALRRLEEVRGGLSER
jgi:hypothetical protein